MYIRDLMHYLKSIFVLTEPRPAQCSAAVRKKWDDADRKAKSAILQNPGMQPIVAVSEILEREYCSALEVWNKLESTYEKENIQSKPNSRQKAKHLVTQGCPRYIETFATARDNLLKTRYNKWNRHGQRGNHDSASHIAGLIIDNQTVGWRNQYELQSSPLACAVWNGETYSLGFYIFKEDYRDQDRWQSPLLCHEEFYKTTQAACKREQGGSIMLQLWTKWSHQVRMLAQGEL